jgi:hypothetical protein
MKIDFNPHAAVQAQSARGPQAQTTPPAPEGSDDGVEITLSQAAKSILKSGDAEYDGNSPAHKARQFIASSLASTSAVDGESLDFSGPFGQIVKMFAPGHNKASEVVEEPDVVPEDGGDVGGITEPTEDGDTTATDGTGETGETGGTGMTDGGDTTVTDGSDGGGETGTTEGDDTTVVAAPEDGEGTGVGETDPMILVEEPDITEILDESVPGDGETSETESGLAGSGDAVAGGSDGSGDTGTTEGAPAAVVDAGDVTDELLELLDEDSEEVV